MKQGLKRRKKRLGRPPKHQSRMVDLVLYLPEELRDWLKAEAEAKGTSVSEMVAEKFKEVGSHGQAYIA